MDLTRANILDRLAGYDDPNDRVRLLEDYARQLARTGDQAAWLDLWNHLEDADQQLMTAAWWGWYYPEQAGALRLSVNDEHYPGVWTVEDTMSVAPEFFERVRYEDPREEGRMLELTGGEFRAMLADATLHGLLSQDVPRRVAERARNQVQFDMNRPVTDAIFHAEQGKYLSPEPVSERLHYLLAGLDNVTLVRTSGLPGEPAGLAPLVVIGTGVAVFIGAAIARAVRGQ